MFKKNKILTILVILAAVFITIFIIFCYMQYSNTDFIRKEYDLENERSKLIKDVANNSINEGKGIDIKKIPTESIDYTITFYGDFHGDKEIYIFHYWIIDNDKYDAKITLSSDYKIIEEDYNVETEMPFEEYKQQKKGTSLTFIIILLPFFYVILFFIYKDYKKI